MQVRTQASKFTFNYVLLGIHVHFPLVSCGGWHLFFMIHRYNWYTKQASIFPRFSTSYLLWGLLIQGDCLEYLPVWLLF